MATLSTSYVDDVFSGNRKYTMQDNGDGTVTPIDETDYTQEGSPFGAADINATNTQINTNTNALDSLTTTVSGHTSAISALQTTVSGHTNTINSHTSAITALQSTVAGHTTQIAQKANTSALGTQVNYTLSGSDLYIVTK